MSVLSKDKAHERVLFRLEKDEDGYPPDDWESLWAFPVDDGLYTLGNVPFFARRISWGDIVSVERKGDELHFRELVRTSGHSVLRVIVYDQSDVDEVHEKLRRMNCDTEQSHLPSLLSVDVPPSVDLDEVMAS